MGYVAQWRAIARTLPEGWARSRLLVSTARDADTERAARLLGPAGPGHSGPDLVLEVTPSGQVGAAAVERLLARLDAEGIGGLLTLSEAEEGPPASAPDPRETELATAWDALVTVLPGDWSDLLCLLELTSSDDLGPAALELGPLNPSRHGTTLGFRFRVARSFGYGAAPQMARRCLARLDERGIPGTLSLLEARSATRPVLTQGPTFTVGGRAV